MTIFSCALEGLHPEPAGATLDSQVAEPGELASLPVERARDRVALERIQRFIEQNLCSNELSPGMICRQIGVSRSQLYRLFSGSPGVAGYIRERRLLRARAVLLSSTEHIGSVAHACGFSSHAHFSRVFKRHFGCTPWQCAVARRGSG